jgi:acetyl-CoA carboxylase carboxyltransferase component
MPSNVLKKKMKELERRLKRARLGGGKERIEKQHKAGKLTARERIDLLLDPGSFMEFDALVEHRCIEFGMNRKKIPGDGVVTGYGTIDGRLVFIFSQDFTVFGGALGEMFGEKVTKIMDLAMEAGAPVIGLNDSGGARIQEGVASLGAYGEIFYRNVLSSGVIPQISAIMGPCAGGAVYSPAVTDFTLMVKDTSRMFITGPNVIKAVTGEVISFEELGGAMTHNAKSGVAQFAAENEDHCFQLIRELLSYIPSNNMENPPFKEPTDDSQRTDSALNELLPDDPTVPYDMKEAIWSVADDHEFLEVHEHFAPNMVVGFIRLNGYPIGVVANQPNYLAGTIDIDASDKCARFVRFCDAFNIPILTFMDVPGFLPGVEQEHRGIIRHGAKILFAYSEATVPKVTVITRKAIGGAYVVLGSKHLRADVVYAWPTCELAVMGPEGAANIIFRREIEKAEDPEKTRAKKIAEYRERFANPYSGAVRGFIDEVIEPAITRSRLIAAFEMLRTKRQALPRKKHGNCPL